jgi:hypothetical protein
MMTSRRLSIAAALGVSFAAGAADGDESDAVVSADPLVVVDPLAIFDPLALVADDPEVFLLALLQAASTPVDAIPAKVEVRNWRRLRADMVLPFGRTRD